MSKSNINTKISSDSNSVSEIHPMLAIASQQPASPTTTTEGFDKDAFIKECGSVSAAIRKLLADGKTRGQVAKMLDKRYQHVRNVEITPIKKTA